MTSFRCTEVPFNTVSKMFTLGREYPARFSGFGGNGVFTVVDDLGRERVLTNDDNPRFIVENLVAGGQRYGISCPRYAYFRRIEG